MAAFIHDVKFAVSLKPPGMPFNAVARVVPSQPHHLRCRCHGGCVGYVYVTGACHVEGNGIGARSGRCGERIYSAEVVERSAKLVPRAGRCDANSRRIDLFGKYGIVDTAGLMTMAQHFASARMEMLPGGFARANGGVPVETVRIEGAVVQVEQGTGVVALVLRHPGFGWVGYHFAPGDAEKFLDHFAAVMRGRPEAAASQ